jgi:serine protease Do
MHESGRSESEERMNRRLLGSPLLVVGLLLTTLLVGACGGQEPSGPEPARTTEDTDARSGGVAEIGDVKDATIYIESGGGFLDADREIGSIPFGRGSGFIIDPEGIALTNNHVVTGAGFIDVYVEGEDEPRGAKILGASECSDLAVIDIEGGGYPYLEWYDGEIEPGLGVSAAGFPADDIVDSDELPDYTLTEGSVNTTEAEDPIAVSSSINSVIEHDALIRGGNSGGPLVDENARVVGVNYAANEETDQSFAISRDEVQDILPDLRTGDVDSVGINGEAIGEVPEEEIPGGIFVYSVKTDSPAYRVGLRDAEFDDETGDFQSFDFITQIEDTDLAKEGSMEEYCKILRNRTSPDQQLSIQVLRASFDENGDVEEATILEGALNGQKLEEVEQVEGDTESEEPAPGYTSVTDDSDTLTMEVPSEWNDVSGGSWAQDNLLDGQELGPQITASPDIQSFTDTWETPGVFFGASSTLVEEFSDDTVNQMLDADFLDFSEQCEYDDRYEYDDGTFVGAEDVWVNCGDTGAEQRNIVALPDDGSYAVLVQHTVVNEEDLEAVQHINETFNVVGEL